MPTVTLNLPDQEFEALEALSKEKGMSKTAVLRQAIKIYQLVDKNGSSVQIDGNRKILVVT